jgi:16S rRNA (adenine1518-N6/adenine1519-N6)-dimethyltransferase
MSEQFRKFSSRPSRRPGLGQNFLVSPTAPRAIVEALGDLSAATVLEIGPGKGAITSLLAARSKRLIAVEFDRALAAALKIQFAGGGSSVEIVSEDILRVDVSRLAAEHDTGAITVVGNLPYYITSDILLHLFRHHQVIDRAVVMVQREVADRIVASPGSRDYGVLSATTQMHARVESLFTLPPGAFSPPPEVHSTVLRLAMQPRFAELRVDRDKFLGFLRTVFAQKRKTLANNLRAAGYGASQTEAAFGACQVNAMVRAEAVPLETMACLFHRFAETTPASPQLT